MTTEEGSSVSLDSGSFGFIPPLHTPDPPSPLAAPVAVEPTSGITRPQQLSIDDDDDDDIDELLSERLWGLTEMFPERLRSAMYSLGTFTVIGTKALFSLGKSATWIAASSASILVLPVMFETERAQLEEQQLQQQRQILLGPNAAVSGAGGGSGLLPGAMPGMMPIPMQPR